MWPFKKKDKTAYKKVEMLGKIPEEKFKEIQEDLINQAIMKAEEEIYRHVQDWVLRDLDFEKIKELTEQAVKERICSLTMIDRINRETRYVVPKGFDQWKI